MKESIGNEEEFWNFIEKATNTKWEDKILCRGGAAKADAYHIVDITKATIEVKSNVVLNDINAKHKLLKKMPNDGDYENNEKTLEDFE